MKESALLSLSGPLIIREQGTRINFTIAQGLAQDGAHVVVSGRKQQKVNWAVAALQREGLGMTAKDPGYARYLKMLQVGVPVMAIRNKMVSEGLDPDFPERPDDPVPDGEGEKNTEESSDGESSFSD
ncbi:hypothetical protein E5288_WYG019657 [Bos mutus]|uniref:WASH complex subunit 3 n=1 Tax=Bos mutus TaxID=72004 RepID=A0A6B0RV96_9CETA|nr:hypothetical protein [Bos mutus]